MSDVYCLWKQSCFGQSEMTVFRCLLPMKTVIFWPIRNDCLWMYMPDVYCLWKQSSFGQSEMTVFRYICQMFIAYENRHVLVSQKWLSLDIYARCLLPMKTVMFWSIRNDCLWMHMPDVYCLWNSYVLANQKWLSLDVYCLWKQSCFGQSEMTVFGCICQIFIAYKNCHVLANYKWLSLDVYARCLLPGQSEISVIISCLCWTF